MVMSDSPEMLQYLSVLLKHGNYTKAAKDLYISQPYLTQTIKKVEQELMVEIIDRHAHPLQLTEAGKLYYTYLNNLESQQQNFRQRIAKYADTDEATIRIGVLSSLGTYLLPLFLPTFLTEHPRINIQLIEALPNDNEHSLLQDDLDFFLGQNPETLSNQLLSHSCGTHYYYAIIPENSPHYQPEKSYLAANQIQLQALLKEPLVLTSQGSAIRRQIDYLMKKHRIQPKIVLESSNIFTVTELAKSGAGVTFVPESIKNIGQGGNYNICPLSNELVSLEYFIAHNSQRSLSDADQALIQTFLHCVAADID